jgi:hypothetical protein
MPLFYSSSRKGIFRGGLWPVAMFWLLALGSLGGQSQTSITGNVVTRDGKPLAGVDVLGGMGKTCCPYQRPHTTTDEVGHFTLQNPGEVMLFYARGFEPHAVVLANSTTELREVMDASTGDLAPPRCGARAKGERRIGGSWGVGFTVPTKEVKVIGGKTDVDYVRFVVRSKVDSAYMEIWFGPYALETLPDDDLLVASDEFSLTNLVAPDGSDFGGDSRGHLKTGGYWRWTSVVGRGGVVFRDVPQADLATFDKIADSICYTPYPQTSTHK